jgi:D-3-phosphoglycerate dehydrogenase / 2-oxoglutarate reductase
MVTKGKILFIDTAHKELKVRLEKQGFQCDTHYNYNREEYKAIVHEYVGVIIRSKIKLDTDFLACCSKLRFIGRVGAGMENIDVHFANENNIVCINAPEGNRDAVGEHAIGMLLGLFNNLIIADNEVRNGKWIREGNRGYEIGGKTIGIIGYGNTGQAFAKKLSGFDAKVIVYDKYKRNIENKYATESIMDDLYQNCDIVSLHVPLNNETTFLVDNNFINRFRKNIYLINTSRGKVLNTRDLVENLENGRVLGACLDVMEYEGLSFENVKLPEEFNSLVSMNNVILSPHIAGWTYESNYKMATTLASKIELLTL